VEERRDPLRRTSLRAALAVVVALVCGAAAEACEPPAGFTPRGRVESSGISVLFRTDPASIVIGRHFTVEAMLCAAGPAAVLTRVDADMPEHRHGMNYRPTLEAKGDGRYVAEGFLFHMPGTWRFIFDVEQGGQRTRLTSDLPVE
jgi:hypothetical protein